MCLTYSKIATDKLRKDNKDKKFIICYKVLKRNNTDLLSPVIERFKWKTGFNTSNRESTKLTKTEIDECSVYTGIHVCLTENVADDYKWYSYEVIVPVRCYLSDLVAASRLGYAVFRRVYLNPHDYKKAIG